MPYENCNFREFFSSLLQNVDIDVLGCSPFVLIASEKLYDRENARSLYSENPTAFLEDYQVAVSYCLQNAKGDNGSAIVSEALVLLRLVDINVSFKLDSKSLADLLIVLSGKLQALETTYKNQKYSAFMCGSFVATQITLTVLAILERKDSEAEARESKDFILDAILQIPVTNVTLAQWNCLVLKHYKRRVDKKVSQVNKALLLYDSLVGLGLANLLVRSTEEKVAQKCKVFDDVGLHHGTQKILEYYSCKTGNEKKRFLSCGIGDIIEYTDMLNALNRFLMDC